MSETTKVLTAAEVAGCSEMQLALDQRGYIVFNTFERYEVGRPVDGLVYSHGQLGDAGQPFMITGITDADDFNAQGRLYGDAPIQRQPGMKFYRAVTE